MNDRLQTIGGAHQRCAELAAALKALPDPAQSAEARIEVMCASASDKTATSALSAGSERSFMSYRKPASGSSV